MAIETDLLPAILFKPLKVVHSFRKHIHSVIQ